MHTAHALKKSPYVCQYGTCTEEQHAKRLCKVHYQAALRNGFLPTKTCAVPRCDRPHSARGLCPMHYQRAKRGRLEVPLADILPVAA